MSNRSHVHSYGPVLAMILLLIAFQLAAPEAEWARLTSVVLQGATILAIGNAAGAEGPRARRIAAWVVVMIGASVALFLFGSLGRTPALILLFGLAVGGPVVIGTHLYADVRAQRRVTVHSMFGVLCIYLLLGLLFASLFGLVHELGDDAFFAQTNRATNTDLIYFSFSTMTTTGYGDLTAATSLGRALAVTEALVGQIYLVTVVALIVSNIGRARD